MALILIVDQCVMLLGMPKIKNMAMFLLLPLLISTVLQILARPIRIDKETKGMQFKIKN